MELVINHLPVRNIARATTYILLLFSLAIFFGMRSLVSGFDTASYIDILDGAKYTIEQGGDFIDYYSKYSYAQPEPLYSFFVYVLGYLDCSPRLYLLTVSFFSIFTFGAAVNSISGGKNVETLLVALCTLSLVFMFANAMRHGMALSISFFAISNLLNENWKKFLFYIFIASLIHSSALLLIPLCLFIRNNKNINIVIFIFSASFSIVSNAGFLSVLNYIPVLSDKLNYYSIDGRAGGWSFYSSLFLPMVVYPIVCTVKDVKLDRLFNVYLYLCVIGFMLSFSFTMYDRISSYRFLFEPIIFIIIASKFKQSYLTMTLTIVLAYVYFIFIVYPSEAIRETLFY